MWSWWEQRSFAHWDIVIVGAGLVGLTAALAVRKQRPHASIVVLERGLLPSGASTKNAGFACFGSLTELRADVAREGVDAAVALVAQRRAGMASLRQLLGDEAMGYEPCGGWELLDTDQREALDHIDGLNRALQPCFGSDAFRVDDDARARFGFGRTAHLVRLPHEGAIDTGRTMRSLWARAQAAEIMVWTGAHVDGLHPHDTGVDVQIGSHTLQAQQVAVCTNAFTRALLPHLAITPGRGQVLVTEPVPDLPFRGVFHHNEGYTYFRHTPDGRVLLGGCRHLDLPGETSTALDLHPGIQAQLDGLLRDVVLPGREVAVAHRWSGIMAFGPERAPIVAPAGERMVVGARLGGMGIALGTSVGERVAALLHTHQP